MNARHASNVHGQKVYERWQPQVTVSLELLPGALAQFTGTSSRVNAVKALRKNYGFFGIQDAADCSRYAKPAYSQPPELKDKECEETA